MEANILIIDSEPETVCAIRRIAGAMGHRVIEAEADLARTAENFVQPPDMVMIDLSGDPSGSDERIETIKSRFEESEILIIAPANEIDRTIARHKSRVNEYVATPVDETALEITLNRLLEKIALTLRVKQLEHYKENHPDMNLADLMETERFIVAKQLVDKLSFFIAQIAQDVEDGVKYFHSTPYFVSIHNCDLRIIANDAAYQKYFGNQIGGKSWQVYFGKAAGPEECPVGKTMQTGMVQRTLAVVRYQSGEKAPVIVHTAPIYDNNGRMAMILEVIAGSREIRRLRKELRTTQQRYQKLFDEVPDYIAVLDRKFRVTALNRRFKEEFGDQTGIGFFDIFTKRTFSMEDCPLIRTLKDGESHHIETELITRDGKRFNTILATAPVNTVGGKIFQIIVIFKDVTELRRLEDNLSTLGLMFSVVSHNIKNVLTGLDAGLYHIDQGFYRNIPGRIEEGLEVANLMAERIRKLILDVLYYAKPRELQLKQIKIGDMVSEVARQIQPKMGARNIDFEHRVEDPESEFLVDRDIFRSILINLLENAMEACMDTHIDRAFTILLKAADQDQQVRFEVIDNGIGMEEGQKKRIFSKFYSTKGHKGTGLGLFIANQVVGQHGGEIRVESVSGEGTHFTILMPKKPAEPKPLYPSMESTGT